MKLATASIDRSALLERVASTPAVEWCQAHSDLVDSVIREIYAGLEAEIGEMPLLSIVATGGYGRRELSPYSDVDVAVIPIEGHPALDHAVKELHKRLHNLLEDDLKLQVGYSYRLVADAAAIDPESRTSFLDSRVVAGSTQPYEAFLERYWAGFPVGEFILNKLQERARAFAKWNDTPLVVEPHIKEGAGGLRSFHCAGWLRAVIGERPLPVSPAYEEILKTRNLLHWVAGKREEQFTRAKQARIVDLIGGDVYELAAAVAAAGVELQREYDVAVSRLSETRVELVEGVVAVNGTARVADGTPAGMAALGVAVATQLGLRIADKHAVTTTGISGPQALYAVRTGEQSIRNLDQCGLLDTLLPELTACRYLMPRDSSHVFTVFEHTLRCIRNLDTIPKNTFLGHLKDDMQDRGTLYLGMLLHDVGKVSEDRRHHSDSGAELAQVVCERWGLSEAATENVVWLVQNHLVMATFSRLRDLQDPRTAHELAQMVKTRNRLSMLTLLTYADVSAVSPEMWTSAYESFLRELFERTSEILDHEQVPHVDAAASRRRILKELRGSETPPDAIEAFLESMPAHYVIGTPTELVRLHMAYEEKARRGEPVVELASDAAKGESVLTVVTPDEPGLLSKILGVIYALDIRVHSIRASTTSETGVALDTFGISFSDRPVPPALSDQLITSLLAVLKHERDYRELLTANRKDPDRKQQFFKFSFREGDPGILEVQAPRGRGMAYRFSKLIAEQGWNIVAARVGQWADRATAGFYLVGAAGRALGEDEVGRALNVSEQ